MRHFGLSRHFKVWVFGPRESTWEMPEFQASNFWIFVSWHFEVLTTWAAYSKRLDYNRLSFRATSSRVTFWDIAEQLYSVYTVYHIRVISSGIKLLFECDFSLEFSSTYQCRL